MIELAFLAPDIIRDVLDGKQPLGFTSHWAKTHSIPSNWVDQRKLLKTLSASSSLPENRKYLNVCLR